MDQKETLAVFSIRPDRFAGLTMVLGRSFSILPISESQEINGLAESPVSAAIVDGTPYRTFSKEVLSALRGRPGGDGIAILEVVNPGTVAETRADPQTQADQVVGADRTTAAMLAAFWQACAKRDERGWAAAEPSVSEATGDAKAAFSVLDKLARGEAVDDPDVVRAVFRTSARSIARSSGLGKAHDLLRAVESHHAYTFAHSLKVATLLTELGRAIGLEETDRILLAEAGLLHDAGKLMVPIDILAKPGRLTEAEFQTMKDHAPLGEELLGALYSDQPEIAIAAGQHHEKLDGSGYPRGLIRSEIHEIGRSCAIVDIYSALTDRRDYKEPMTMDAALDLMRPMAGPLLEARLFDVFEAWMRDEVER